MSMICVENLSKSFGPLQILKHVSLTVEKGERIVIIGASGCGKSVFLRCMNLLETPDEGRVFVCGKELTAAQADVNRIRRHIGMVYQGFHLFTHLNVMDNLTLAPVKLLGKSKKDAEEQALALLNMVGLENRKYAMPDALSGGQKQRIAIARCLAMEPEVMLFDEPTSALDPTMVGEVLATLRLLAKRDMTMVIVTHEMTFAREIATRVLYLDEQGIYEEGTPAEIFEMPKREKTRNFIHKMKYFAAHIENRNFDLMQLQGGIRGFADRYGIDDKRAYRLQLCTEELVYEMLDGIQEKETAEKSRNHQNADMDVTVSYDEQEKKTAISLRCKGGCYNPFAEKEDAGIHLGVTILQHTASRLEHRYLNGWNEIEIEIV